MRIVSVPVNYYQQFDADFAKEVPAEGYEGWKKAELPLNLDTTALVVMHAWDAGSREAYPGWHRAVEYLPRSYEISRRIFPGLLRAARQSGLHIFHVGSAGVDYSRYPGFRRAQELAGPEPGPAEQIRPDPILKQLEAFRFNHVFPGERNAPDQAEGFRNIAFLQEAEPLDEEAIAATEHQLFALCRNSGINHLIYVGFALNWCLLLSPGGMADMSKRGIMCSTIRQAVTAVENKETAAKQLNKEEALWRVALAFGFVYDVDDLVAALSADGASR